MAYNECYTDPTSGNDTTGDGSSGTPFKTVQKCLDAFPGGNRASGNPDRINVKAGGTDTLGAALVFTTYGTPTATAWLTIQGYTSTAGDGGMGVIDGAATYSIISSATLDYICLVNMTLQNSGAANVIALDDYNVIYGCQIKTATTFAIGLSLSAANVVMNCEITGLPLGVEFTGGGNVAAFNYFKDCFISSINDSADWETNFIYRNIVKVKDVQYAIGIDSDGVSLVMNNSVVAQGVTTSNQIGIANSSQYTMVFLNNIISGFSGTFHSGISISDVFIEGGNHTHNCTTDYTISEKAIDLGDDDTDDTTDPFTDSANDNFSPINVASVKKGAASGSLPHDADAWNGV